jgi:DNA polymerase-3 subunit alpha
MSKFVNLHGHTYGSVLDAIIRPAELFKRAKELGHKAIAITDHGNMSQIYPAYKESKKTGVKLIPGNEVYFVEDLDNPKSKRRHLVLLAANHEGYKNLCRITYEGFLNSVTVMGKEFPRITADILRKYNAGLFATSACGGSIIAAHLYEGDNDGADRHAKIFADIFGDRFFIEIQPHTLKRGNFDQVQLNNMLKGVAERLGIRMVATCDSHYLTPEDEKFHDMVLAISDKKSLSDLTRHRYVSSIPCGSCAGSGCEECGSTGIGEIIPCPEFYLKTEDEVRGFFSKQYSPEFAEQLISNTSMIADQCEEPKYLEPSGERIPKYDMRMITSCKDHDEFVAWLAEKPARQSIPVDNAYLRFRVAKRYRDYTKGFDRVKQKQYWERLEAELEILEARGFCSYMLIVADAIQWAESEEIWTGIARGSAGSSLIAYFLGIHKLDPIPYGLLFERFQNKERAQCPDIDTDILSSGRDRLIKYISERWGPEYVAQITNVNRITPKVAIKDIAKSLEVGGTRQESFAIAEKITKEIPLKVTKPDGKIIEINTVALAKEYSPTLVDFFKRHPEVEAHAEKVVGLPRSWGVHAGGVIVSDVPLPEFVPLRRDSDGTVSVHYDKYVSEEVGLIKIDMLGLDTLDVLREAHAAAHKMGIALPKPWEVPEDDQRVYKMISDGDVLGLFQLEGGTLAQLCKPMQPKTIEDISLINALGRPGVDKAKRKQFIERRHGRQEVEYAHPELEHISKATLGISVYDEDLLKIANHIAGWSLSEADGLRKLTKLKEKGAELAAKLEKKFVDDAEKLGRVTRKDAQFIWDNVIADYAKYGFCKAHSVAYSRMGYATAYYKYHARAAFLCAYLNQEISKKTPDTAAYIEQIKKEVLSSGISIRACDINLSGDRYRAINKKSIVTGLNAVNGVGDVAIGHIFAGQPYNSLADFVYRSPSSVNRKTIISLAKAGAFDGFNISRRWICEAFSEEKRAKQLRTKINALGDAATKDGSDARDIDWSGFDYLADQNALRVEWSRKDILLGEKEALGEFISGSAEEVFGGFFKNIDNPLTRANMMAMPKFHKVILEGIVLGIDQLPVRTGKNAGRMQGKLRIESLKKEDFEVSIWPDDWELVKPRLEVGLPVIMRCTVREWNESKSLNLEDIVSIWKEK